MTPTSLAAGINRRSCRCKRPPKPLDIFRKAPDRTLPVKYAACFNPNLISLILIFHFNRTKMKLTLVLLAFCLLYVSVSHQQQQQFMPRQRSLPFNYYYNSARQLAINVKNVKRLLGGFLFGNQFIVVVFTYFLINLSAERALPSKAMND